MGLTPVQVTVSVEAARAMGVFLTVNGTFRCYPNVSRRCNGVQEQSASGERLERVVYWSTGESVGVGRQGVHANAQHDVQSLLAIVASRQ